MQSNTNPMPDPPLPTSISSIINLGENKVEGPNGEDKKLGADNKADGILGENGVKKDTKKSKN